jgi:SAM-dependent methyltransferase
MNDHELAFDRAHPGRIYDYYLGGRDNYPRDREAGRAALREWPAARANARANRAFMRRVTRYLAAEKGITQFLDIGTGIPTSPNLHEVAQAVTPSARIVYVDHDPIVLAHAKALLTGTRQGATNYIHADLCEPESIIDSPQLRDTLDLTRPVSLTLIAVMHFIDDRAKALRVTRRLLEVLPSGSYLSLSTATDEFDPVPIARVVSAYRSRGMPILTRTKAEVEQFFDGLEMIPPGVVQVHRWHPDRIGVDSFDDNKVPIYGGMARKT